MGSDIFPLGNKRAETNTWVRQAPRISEVHLTGLSARHSTFGL
jgi:hypothetical protein